MIISIAAPKGGVGSSTFALLLTQERAKLSKTLLVSSFIDLIFTPILLNILGINPSSPDIKAENKCMVSIC